MKLILSILRYAVILWLNITLIATLPAFSQANENNIKNKKPPGKTTLYGTASYYAQKFQGRGTASGDKFDQEKFTAACNALPLGTWVLVTNLNNSKTVYVRINDRLSNKSTRLLDLSKAAARELGFLSRGLTRIKIEVLQGKPGRAI